MIIKFNRQSRYDEVKNFILNNKRNPSKYAPEERLMCPFLKRNRKLINAGLLKENRVEEFKMLLELMEQYKRKNQYE